MRSLKEDGPRPYTLRARADKQAETHRILAEAAYALHTTVGPPKATISAIAEKAGVQRLTVYRHFPDQEAIFAACTAHSFAKDPPPNPETWRGVADPAERLRTALGELYGYYGRNERLLLNLYHDAELPVVAAALARRTELLARGAAILREGWTPKGRNEARLLPAALSHSLDFAAWRTLSVDSKVEDTDIIELMLRLVESLVRS
jgi:AcrR family transcriptional regulator